MRFSNHVALDACSSFLRISCRLISLLFQICFKSIIEQTTKIRLKCLKRYFSPSIILGIWWLSSNILITAYKSKLWAISIQNYQIEPSNLQELLDNHYEIVVNSQNDDLIEDIFTASDRLILEAKRYLLLLLIDCD